jgi:hypothetical protein
MDTQQKKFQESLIHYISEMLNEKIDHVNWPNNVSSDINKLQNQFATLEWKKNRIRN